MAREVRKFWLKINKVIAFRQKGEADDVRQKVRECYETYLKTMTVATTESGNRCSYEASLYFSIVWNQSTDSIKRIS
jgi:hypothetical protein